MWQEKIRTYAQTKWFAVAAASVTSLATGATISHILTKKHIDKKIDALIADEIAKTRAFYERRNKEGEYSDPTKLAEKYQTDSVVEESPEPIHEDMVEAEERIMREAAEALAKMYNYSQTLADLEKPSRLEEAEVQESLKKSIWDDHVPEEPEVDPLDKSLRTSDRPYILEEEEFFESDTEFAQQTLSYFEGDDVLLDDQEQPIRDIANVVGVENLQFGLGTKNDQNVVYIRNEKLRLEFEITRSFGKYTEEVLGFIEHSDKSRPRKFRDYD